MNKAPASGGRVIAPHYLAAEAGESVLAEGGNAIEAMIAAASTIAVVYPHMNGIGGDGFWLIRLPDGSIRAIEACGSAGQWVNADYYRQKGLDRIPSRGPLAANTVAGTVGGWSEALKLSNGLNGRLPLDRLLEAAVQVDDAARCTAGTVIREHDTGSVLPERCPQLATGSVEPLVHVRDGAASRGIVQQRL